MPKPPEPADPKDNPIFQKVVKKFLATKPEPRAVKSEGKKEKKKRRKT